jgi:hypothetical protein
MKTELAKELDVYIKKHKTQEECSGFIDGFEKACAIFELGKASFKVPTKEIWDLACRETLNDISKTFKENSHKGETNGDRDVFEAISDTIVNFPIPEMPITLSLPESKPLTIERIEEIIDTKVDFNFQITREAAKQIHSEMTLPEINK